MNDIQHAVNEEREAASGSSFKALLKNGQQKFFYGTMLGIGGQFMQQLSGINLITYYAPVIFEQSVGMPHSLSLLLAGFNGVAYWVSSLIAIRIIDRLGRRKLMLFAAAGQGVCMAILAATVSNGMVQGLRVLSQLSCFFCSTFSSLLDSLLFLGYVRNPACWSTRSAKFLTVSL